MATRRATSAGTPADSKRSERARKRLEIAFPEQPGHAFEERPAPVEKRATVAPMSIGRLTLRNSQREPRSTRRRPSSSIEI